MQHIQLLFSAAMPLHWWQVPIVANRQVRATNAVAVIDPNCVVGALVGLAISKLNLHESEAIRIGVQMLSKHPIRWFLII